MEFTVRKFDLLQELTLIQGVVERKTTIPILANVLLSAKDGHLGIVATDLEIGLKATCESQVTAPGTITLPAKRLYEIVRALPDKEIRFKQGEGNWVTVTCAGSRFRIAGLSQEDFPQLPVQKKGGISIPAATMAQLISRTIYAISAEDSKYTFSGALLVFKPGSLTMVATDGHRLSYVERRGALDKDDDVSEESKVLIPKKAMSELSRMLTEAGAEGGVRFSRDENHLFFDLGTRLLISRVLSGQFPNWEAVIPRNNERTFSVGRDVIAAAIRRVAILADERSKTVRFSLTKRALEIASSHSDLGDASEAMEVEYAGEEFEIGFNYQYLIDFLSTIPETEVSFEFKDGESATQLRALPGEDYNSRYIVMPMRI
jgi:DNA polymerase-3 subunit beta